MANKENYTVSVTLNAVDKTKLALKSLNKNIKSLNKSVNNNIKNINTSMKAFQGIATTTFLAVGGAAGLAVREYANFEQQMSSVKALTNATGETFAMLEKQAIELGKTTQFTGKQAGEGMEFLAKAGFKTDEIMKAIGGTLDLASASGIDLGRSADIASNVLSGFALSADQTNRIVDVLAKTVNTSNTDMEQLSEAMKYLAPTAANLGVSIEETAAVIGTLGNFGLQGSIATTTLQSSLSRLAKPTNDMKKVMAELNLEVFNSKGEFVGFGNLIENLEQGLEGYTDKQKQAALSTLFGQLAVKNWSSLLRAGSTEVKAYTKELEEADGTAKRIAATKLDNLKGDITLLKSAVSGLGITFGKELTPALRNGVQTLTKFINENEESFQRLAKILGEKVNKFVDNFGKNIKKIGDFFRSNRTLFNNFVEIFKKYGPIIGKVAIGIGALSLALSPIVGLISKIGILFKALTGPIGLLLTGIGLLGYKWVESVGGMENATEILKTKFGDAFEFITEKFEQFKNWFEKNKETFNKIGTRIGGAFKDIGRDLKENFGRTLDLINNALERLFGNEKKIENWGFVFEVAFRAIGNILNWVLIAINAVIEGLIGLGIAIDNVLDKWSRIGGEKLDKFIINAFGGEEKLANFQSYLEPFKRERALGGSTSINEPTLVGERGPEIFVPKTSGVVIPNNEIQGGMGGMNININLGGVVVQKEADENRLAEKIKRKLFEGARQYQRGFN